MHTAGMRGRGEPDLVERERDQLLVSVDLGEHEPAPVGPEVAGRRVVEQERTQDRAEVEDRVLRRGRIVDARRQRLQRDVGELAHAVRRVLLQRAGLADVDRAAHRGRRPRRGPAAPATSVQSGDPQITYRPTAVSSRTVPPSGTAARSAAGSRSCTQPSRRSGP